VVYHVGPLPARRGNVGGAGSYLRELVERLTRDGVRSEVLCQRDLPDSDVAGYAFTVRRCWNFGPYSLLQATFALAGARGIVHVQYETALFGSVFASMQLSFLLMLWRALGLGTVVTLHHVIPANFTVADLRLWKAPHAFDRVVLWLLRRNQYAIARAASRTIVHEASQRRVLAGAKGIACVPLFVPDREPAPDIGSVPGHALRLAFFGFLAEYKGLRELIDAVNRIRSSGGSVELEVVGGEHPRLSRHTAYRRFIADVMRESAREGAVTLHGFLPDSDVDRTLGACGLFVFPYRATIAASAAVARAIALGKPFAVSQRLAATLELPGETLVCGDTVDQIQRFLQTVSVRQLHEARALSLALREERSLARIADTVARIYRDLTV